MKTPEKRRVDQRKVGNRTNKQDLHLLFRGGEDDFPMTTTTTTTMMTMTLWLCLCHIIKCSQKQLGVDKQTIMVPVTYRQPTLVAGHFPELRAAIGWSNGSIAEVHLLTEGHPSYFSAICSFY